MMVHIYRSAGDRRLLYFALPVLLGFLSGGARAQIVNVNIGVTNANIQDYTSGFDYPSGGTILTNGGVTFALAYYTDTSGLGVLQTPTFPQPFSGQGTSFDIRVNIPNQGAVYTLINSAYGQFGDTVGSMEFKATGGLDYSVNLVEGQDIRDHFNGSFNNTIGTGALGPIYIHTFSFGPVRLDEQEFVLPASFDSATLTDIILNGTGSVPNGVPFLAAATVAPATAGTIPEPSGLVLLSMGLAGTAIFSAWRSRSRRKRQERGQVR
jgi:hypothetical protein